MKITIDIPPEESAEWINSITKNMLEMQKEIVAETVKNSFSNTLTPIPNLYDLIKDMTNAK